ncbi:ribonuclease kappa-A-like isoform X2 [Achroia grisella]|uniref:ribonuclease kappa-A-like isoform X2 n=1 Tax=Achroia grisella TaxID=688607 RepID=UPI0027D2B25E|nr:ribonuclease kappa-A-like isoform X2 [Achroia grisella]
MRIANYTMGCKAASHSLMALFYKIEASILIEDVEEHVYDDYDDFIKKTKNNYQATSLNCLIAAAIYALMIGLSYLCIRKARSNERKAKEKLEDDEYYCAHLQKRK